MSAANLYPKSETQPTLVLWADGRREILDVIPYVYRLIVPVCRPFKAVEVFRRRLEWDRVEFKREAIRYPSDWHGPHESHFVRDPDTGAVFGFRYREVTP